MHRSHKNTPSKESDCNTYVFIWDTIVPKSVGHAAIQIGGCKPKMDANEINSGEYISIHPRVIPAIGPTTILPLPATLSKTLSDDMEIEAGYQNATKDVELSIPSSFEKNPPSHLKPDRVFKFTHLDTNAMNKFIQSVNEEVPTCQTSYQLFPKINALGFFKCIPDFITYNPVDIKAAQSSKRSKSTYGQNSYNCATLVGKILEKGGMSINESNTPWGLSPNELANQLSEHVHDVAQTCEQINAKTAGR